MARNSSIIRALRRGQTLARRGKTADALAAFDAADDAKDARLAVQHALVLLRSDDADGALRKAADAVAAAPDDSVAAAFNAYVLLRAGRIDKGERAIERAAKLAPANPIPSVLSAALDILRGDTSAGCRKLLDGPLTDNLELLGWILALVERAVFERVGTDSGAIPPDDEADKASDVAPDSIPARSAKWCAGRGEKLLEAGKPNAAAAYLKQAVDRDPEKAEIRALYGAALLEAGEFERAEPELARAPKDGALAGVAQFYRATNAYRLGRYEETIGLLDTLPMTGDAVLYAEWFDYVRGMTLVALGRIDEAGRCLAAFLDTEPGLLKKRLKKALTILAEEPECSTQS